jgi:hypothetical protein
MCIDRTASECQVNQVVQYVKNKNTLFKTIVSSPKALPQNRQIDPHHDKKRLSIFVLYSHTSHISSQSINQPTSEKDDSASPYIHGVADIFICFRKNKTEYKAPPPTLKAALASVGFCKPVLYGK